jgi:hypothetical protein
MQQMDGGRAINLASGEYAQNFTSIQKWPTSAEHRYADSCMAIDGIYRLELIPSEFASETLMAVLTCASLRPSTYAYPRFAALRFTKRARDGLVFPLP